MTKPARPRIAVLGGGPVGVEAALYATSLGLPVTLYEQGHPGEYLNRWGFVRMFTPFGLNASPLGKKTLRDLRKDLPADTDFQTGRQFRDSYLLPLADSPALKFAIKPQTTVLAVGRSGWRKNDPPAAKLPPFRLLVRTADNHESVLTADAVFDCTGTYARPNWVGDGGVPAVGEVASRPHVAYWLEDVLGAKKQQYLGRHTVVVGGGYSAAATVVALTELAEENPSTWVTWLTRGPRTQPLVRIAGDPLRDRDKLAARANTLATRCDGNLEHHAHAEVQEVVCPGPDKGVKLVATVGGVKRTWEAERLIANVGYKPDVALTSELRVGEPAGDFRTAEPGYFVLGAKSKGRDSAFLLHEAHEQIRRAFAEVTGNGKLNLYAA
jgi:thioredoxin reductase